VNLTPQEEEQIQIKFGNDFAKEISNEPKKLFGPASSASFRVKSDPRTKQED
jgi:hypothetical protein